MGNTIGYHIVISGYGLWLPGDERGHWSEAWDAQLGYVEPHTLHAGDAMRRRMAQERQKFPPTKLTPRMQAVITATLERCEEVWRNTQRYIERHNERRGIPSNA